MIELSREQQAIRDWEAAEKEAERLRQEYRERRQTRSDPWLRFTESGWAETEAAILYAAAADNAAILKEAYEALVMETLERERWRA